MRTMKLWHKHHAEYELRAILLARVLRMGVLRTDQAPVHLGVYANALRDSSSAPVPMRGECNKEKL